MYVSLTPLPVVPSIMRILLHVFAFLQTSSPQDNMQPARQKTKSVKKDNMQPIWHLTQSQNVLQNLNSSHRLCLELRSTTSFFYFSVCCTCFCLFSRAGCKINIAQHNGYRIVKTDEANGITIIHCNVKHSLSDEALFTNVKIGRAHV